MSSAPHVPQTVFPPNVPPKLIEKFIASKSKYSALARKLKINKSYVHKLIKDGIEPTNGDIRVKLFLPRKYRKSMPAWVKQGADFLKAQEEKNTL